MGIEGLLGTIIYVILLLLFQHISCDSWSHYRRNNFCVINDEKYCRIEDTIFAYNFLFCI